ncbi:MAG: ABC transporter ATP-binding protein [Clostridia bacterium]|nr:ABC transporter ATP-binding protein [Clostridia bacterium]
MESLNGNGLNAFETSDNSKLIIENVTKQYGDGEAALNDVSFDVKKGEFLSVLGPSGCGKTTLLRIIVGLLAPSEGRILLDGEDITSAPPSKRKMGMVFQNYALFENMTVRENICYAARLKAKKEKKFDKTALSALADGLMERVGLSDHASKRPSELSGGQQQRVAIARTLILNPGIMLFDEPMSALDVATRLQLRALIKEIQAEFGTTMIYITHDQEEAFAMSDRILVMENSRVCQIDTPENILVAPANDYVRRFVADNLRTKIASLRRFMDATETQV